jgi:hypothetical protein
VKPAPIFPLTQRTFKGRGGESLGTDSYNRRMDAPARHLRLLTETIAAVNSTLDLEEVLSLVARKVAEALDAESSTSMTKQPTSSSFGQRTAPPSKP